MNAYYLECLGKNLQKARKAKGLSLRQLSSLCTSDHSDINRIEKGKVNIGILKLIELSRALDIHPAVLLDFDINPPQQQVEEVDKLIS